MASVEMPHSDSGRTEENWLLSHYQRTSALPRPIEALSSELTPAEPNPNVEAFAKAQKLITSLRETTEPNPSLLEQFWANIDDR
jgi:hypothetical protein